LGVERGIKPSKKPRPEDTNIFLRHDVANPTLDYSKTEIFRVQSLAPPAKPITSPVSDAWYPTLALLMLSIGLVVTASFFITLRFLSIELYLLGDGWLLLSGEVYEVSSADSLEIPQQVNYEATSSKRNRCLAKELITGGVASVFLLVFMSDFRNRSTGSQSFAKKK
ncbi:hypothetical protein Goarm_001369, partial [Gossypium armourianum]|nr:hypothetical protein [Gossypium armourianum]